MDGLSSEEARSRFWLMDSMGLVTDAREDLEYFKAPYAREDELEARDLLEVVNKVNPTILIGTSTAKGAFTKEVVKTMASKVEHPIIFPISNPPSLAEADPADLLKWTDGKALVATGSPCKDIEINGNRVSIAQCNNAFIFPGLGLGVICARPKRVTPAMINAAVEKLSLSVELGDLSSRLLPEVSRLREVSKNIAVAVVQRALDDGTARIDPETNAEKLVEENIWNPVYKPYKSKVPEESSK